MYRCETSPCDISVMSPSSKRILRANERHSTQKHFLAPKGNKSEGSPQTIPGTDLTPPNVSSVPQTHTRGTDAYRDVMKKIKAWKDAEESYIASPVSSLC